MDCVTYDSETSDPSRCVQWLMRSEVNVGPFGLKHVLFCIASLAGARSSQGSLLRRIEEAAGSRRLTCSARPPGDIGRMVYVIRSAAFLISEPTTVPPQISSLNFTIATKIQSGKNRAQQQLYCTAVRQHSRIAAAAAATTAALRLAHALGTYQNKTTQVTASP